MYNFGEFTIDYSIVHPSFAVAHGGSVQGTK